MSSGVPAAKSIGQRIIDELKEFLVLAAYLYVCFTALAYLKAAILQAHGIAFAPFGFAAVKALICAKFMSVGTRCIWANDTRAGLLSGRRSTGRSFSSRCYWSSAHWKRSSRGSFSIGRFSNSISSVGGGTLDQLIATSFVVLLILIPFFAFRTLGEVVREDNLVRVFFHGRPASDHG